MPPSAIEPSQSHTNGTVHPKASTLKTTASPEPSRYHASSTDEAIQAEADYAAHNYHPLPIVFSKASGAKVWDPEGREYLDFLSAYSAVNQGHCHPELVKALTEQASRLTLSSRAFYNDVFPRFAKFVTQYFGFDMVLPMNTGAEAVETAVKVARKWAYKVKGVPQNEAIVLSVADNFHGRTFGAISLSTDPESRENYGPYLPNIGSACPATGKTIPYDDVSAIKTALSTHGPKVAALIVEPIQGEAGIVVPSSDYLSSLHSLCTEHNVLLIIDEIQTGIARTGKLLCHDHAGIKPDLVCLGKALSGGMYPVSCVLGSKEVMLTLEPGTHGSTYGGNPLGSAVAIRALEVIRDENMVERAAKLGEMFRQGLRDLQSPVIKIVRGMGLLNAIIVDETRLQEGKSAWDVCLRMKEKGLLVGRALKIAHVRGGEGKGEGGDSDIVGGNSDSTSAFTANFDRNTMADEFFVKQAKPTHTNIIRLAPPLVISEDEIRKAVRIVGEAIGELSKGDA